MSLLLLLTACGGQDDSGGSGGEGGIEGVSVSAGSGKAPQVDVAQNVSVAQTRTEVLAQGEGPRASRGGSVVVDFVAVNARTGKTFDNTYESGTPQTFPLDPAQGLPNGIVDALVGRRAGSRVAAAVPPKELFGPQGNPQAQVGGKDTVVFVFDVRQVSDPDPRQQIEPKGAELPAGLPRLRLDDSGTPQGFRADGSTRPAPKKLGLHTLVEGDGPKVESGDLITVHYLGQIYPEGEVFDQSYTRGEPTTFRVGAGSLIPAWDQGLVGLREGSRVVLVVPPEQGYGPQGNPQAGIKGSDTLIFVVDVLGVG